MPPPQHRQDRASTPAAGRTSHGQRTFRSGGAGRARGGSGGGSGAFGWTTDAVRSAVRGAPGTSGASTVLLTGGRGTCSRWPQLGQVSFAPAFCGVVSWTALQRGQL